jgi:TRAP-type C4-dicarboxylate transport system substrate-binding protein
MVAAGMELYNKYQPKELADTHVLFIYACGPGYLHADFPLETAAQLDGLRIRCSGTSTRAIELVGADPIAMPMADVYEAAQKGTIDALVSPAETLEGWKHNELFDYSTLFNQIYASDFFWVAMNLDKWNSLPDDLKAAFESVAAAGATQAGAIWDYAHEHAIEVSGPLGHKIAVLPDAEKAKVTEMIKPIRDEYLAYLNEAGLPGDQIIADCVSMMEKANAVEYEKWTPPTQ